MAQHMGARPATASSFILRPSSFILAAVVALTVASPALAQGRKADYDRAARLGALTRNKVFKARVVPHWLEGDTRFWYRNDLANGAREFILVDAAAAMRGPAFDHARVAEALSKATNVRVKADHLPVEAIDLPAGGQAVLLYADKKTWEFTPATGALRERTDVTPVLPSLAASRRPRPSRETGPETTITIVNRTSGEVSVFWVDTEGQRRAYGTIRPGERREQHTFTGHVWLVTAADGRVLGVYEAAELPGTALVDGTVADERPQGRQRPRPPAPSGASPDGHWSATIQENNIWLREASGGTPFALTTDGTPGDSYGGAIYWSPDSRCLVALKTQPAQEHKVYLIDSSPADQVQPKLRTLDYLKPGDRIAVSKPHLFDVSARKEIPVADTLFSNPWDIGDVRWDADSARFTFQYNQRGHQVLRVVAVDAHTGKASAVVDEQSRTFIDYAGKSFISYLESTGEILWMSERDGWNHLYLYDARSGTVKNQVTKGEWVVRGVDRVDEKARQVWFRAGGIVPGQDPYYIHYCRVNFDGTGLVDLTPGGGTHSVVYSPDNRYVLDTYSRVEMPPVTELRRTEDGKLVCMLERADARPLFATGWLPPERFTAKGRDGATDIYGVIVRPTNFSAHKRYPVIECIYAGPQGSFVPKAWSSFSGLQELAELGFVVVQIDGMGTSNRSKAFHDVCWRNLADAGFPDRILWMKAAAATRPWMDLTRVGIYGTSAGGQNALGGLLFHPEFYKAGVADCGCHDNRMDKIWWNELWMGWPVGPQYAESSNVTNAAKLQGKLLLMVGEVDNNVDPSSTMQVVNALIKADKDFELIVAPGVGHGVAGTPYGKRRLQDLFVRSLLGVTPRS